MKKSLLAFCCILASIVHGQSTKNGIYATSNKSRGFENEYFHFAGGNTFKYLNFSCTGSGFGTGHYEIRNDSVYLKFEKCDFCIRKYDLETIKGTSDSLKIDFKIMEGHYPFPTAIALIVERKESLMSDFNGNIKKTILKNGHDITLQISAVGYETSEIKIDSKTTAISGILTLNNNWFYDPEIQAFKILQTAKNEFSLSKGSKNLIYEKLTNHKAKKKLKALTANQDIDFYLEYFL